MTGQYLVNGADPRYWCRVEEIEWRFAGRQRG